MIIAYTRTYSNKQQSDNQKNAIEQFAANNNMTIDKWHKDTRTTSSRHKNRLDFLSQFARSYHVEPALQPEFGGYVMN